MRSPVRSPGTPSQIIKMESLFLYFYPFISLIMINQFLHVTEGILKLITDWTPRLMSIDEEILTAPKNSQGRSVRQILGHLVDSASNNTHRIVHLQYQSNPLIFPNYATHGNNDRWIAIQDYQHEDWNNLVGLWKYSNLHFAYIIGNIDPGKLTRQWDSGDDRLISLEEMVISYLPHLELHLREIEELICL